MSLSLFRLEVPSFYEAHDVGHPHHRRFAAVYGYNTWDLRYHPEYTTAVPTGSGFEVTSDTSTTSYLYSESPLDPQMKSEYNAITTFAAMLMTPPPVRIALGVNWVLHEMDSY